MGASVHEAERPRIKSYSTWRGDVPEDNEEVKDDSDVIDI